MAAGFLAGHAAVSAAVPLFPLSLCFPVGFSGWCRWVSLSRTTGILASAGSGLETVAIERTQDRR